MENPKIRFKGYTKDWEQHKLGDEAEEILAGGDIDKEKAVDDGVYPIYANALTNDGIVGYYDDYYRVKAPAVTVTGRGEVGRARARMIDFTPVVRLLAVRSNHDCYFLENAINNHKVVVESTGVPQLTVPQLSSYDICFPKDIVEEKKIGTYFNQLDRLITLHQRKCEQTKKLKKYMLQKMFPQNGAKVPEIRFDGFTYDWEQRKFSELYARSSEKNDGSIGMDKNITVATMQFKNDVKVSTTEYLKTYYTFKLGDIAFEGHQSKEFRYGRFVENDIGNGIVSHIFAVFRPIQEYDLYFWKYAINNETLMQRILARSTKASTMMHDLVTNDFLNETFLVPSVKEQKQIGAFLNKLDNLITLHQRKCDELKKMKKYMLQNMFI